MATEITRIIHAKCTLCEDGLNMNGVFYHIGPFTGTRKCGWCGITDLVLKGKEEICYDDNWIEVWVNGEMVERKMSPNHPDNPRKKKHASN